MSLVYKETDVRLHKLTKILNGEKFPWHFSLFWLKRSIILLVNGHCGCIWKLMEIHFLFEKDQTLSRPFYLYSSIEIFLIATYASWLSTHTNRDATSIYPEMKKTHSTIINSLLYILKWREFLRRRKNSLICIDHSCLQCRTSDSQYRREQKEYFNFLRAICFSGVRPWSTSTSYNRKPIHTNTNNPLNNQMTSACIIPHLCWCKKF